MPSQQHASEEEKKMESLNGFKFKVSPLSVDFFRNVQFYISIFSDFFLQEINRKEQGF